MPRVLCNASGFTDVFAPLVAVKVQPSMLATEQNGFFLQLLQLCFRWFHAETSLQHDPIFESVGVQMGILTCTLNAYDTCRFGWL